MLNLARGGAYVEATVNDGVLQAQNRLSASKLKCTFVHHFDFHVTSV